MSVNRKISRTGLLIFSFVLSLIGSSAGESSARQSQVLDLNGRAVEPFQLTDAQALVLVFLRTDCPISNRYAPEVKRLSQKFSGHRVTFRLIYPGADETVEAIRQHVKDYDYSIEPLRDPQHELVKLTGVEVTPETAVFVPDKSAGPQKWRMVYCGRIDDRYVAFGKMRPAPTVRDLEQVLAAIAAGREVKTKVTKAVGCFISS